MISQTPHQTPRFFFHMQTSLAALQLNVSVDHATLRPSRVSVFTSLEEPTNSAQHPLQSPVPAPARDSGSWPQRAGLTAAWPDRSFEKQHKPASSAYTSTACSASAGGPLRRSACPALRSQVRACRWRDQDSRRRSLCRRLRVTRCVGRAVGRG